GNDPVNAFDPDGRSTWVTDIGDGLYQVIGGDLNDKDRNVYVYTNDKNGKPTVRGKSIGKTATMTSFYNSDYNEGEGRWTTESIIDMNDSSGEQFLSGIINENPPLFDDYIVNAQNGGLYDFKVSNGTSGTTKELDHYRGMQIGKAKDGSPVLASARDIGNIAAGYIAAVNGLSWKTARLGFDGYQTIVNGTLSIEGISTQSAELYGYTIGILSTTSFHRGMNMCRSITSGAVAAFRKIYSWIK
ncbi:MAG: hypothetical protein NC095_09325, partial [Muribaculum sp.]|nr:hypothetical protein [Muribaculum sp.]